MLFVILFSIAVFVLIVILKRHTKKLLLPNCTLFTGALKTGKTCLCVFSALKTYRSQLIKYYISTKIFRKKGIEKPLLYSNIPLSCDYVPLTKDLLMRRKRFNYGSVCIISECSLVADSMNYKDKAVNDTLTLFNKLYAHETWGGYLFYDTQALSDCHYSIKRVCSSYFWIQSSIKWLPFFVLMNVRELIYNADSENVMNNFNSDVEDSTKWVVVPKKIWRYYDRYCNSILTDNLPVENNVIHGKKLKNLKCDNIVRLRDFERLFADK